MASNRTQSSNFELEDNRLLRQFRHRRRIRQLIIANDERVSSLEFARLAAYHYLGRAVFFLRGWWHRKKYHLSQAVGKSRSTG